MAASIDEGFSLHVTIYIDPSNVEKFFALFKPVYDKVIKEHECLFFEVYQDLQNPGTVRWVENWSKSPQWFMEVRSNHLWLVISS